jgi:hypothetical protein
MIAKLAKAWAASLLFALWTGLAVSGGAAAMFLAITADLHARGVL